jgi:hypothetical protein
MSVSAPGRGNLSWLPAGCGNKPDEEARNRGIHACCAKLYLGTAQFALQIWRWRTDKDYMRYENTGACARSMNNGQKINSFKTK